MTSSAIFTAEIDSDVPESADSVTVTGDVNLTDTTLLASDLGSTLRAGIELVLIDYTGTLTGTFLGRAEGSSITIGVNTYVLSYVGGDGTAVTLSIAGTDYDLWAGPSGYNLVGGPTDDDDGDGVSNEDEYAFGLDPTSAASVTPVTVGLDKTAGTFSYTRRNPGLSGLTYTIETSTDLVTFTPDGTAAQNVVGTSGDVQTVEVTVTGAPLTDPKFFVRVVAN